MRENESWRNCCVTIGSEYGASSETSRRRIGTNHSHWRLITDGMVAARMSITASYPYEATPPYSYAPAMLILKRPYRGSRYIPEKRRGMENSVIPGLMGVRLRTAIIAMGADVSNAGQLARSTCEGECARARRGALR